MTDEKPLTAPQYEKMAADLLVMSDMIRARPEMNHHFAERLAVLSKEMLEDEARAHPNRSIPDSLSSNVLHQLIYFSTFSPTFPTDVDQQDEEITKIVRASITNNSKTGLTGLLLAHQNWFLQVLEGPAVRLMACYDVIVADPRHVNPTLMGNKRIAKREFYNWDMCSRRLSSANDAILATLGVEETFSPTILKYENALKLLMAIRTIQSRPEPLAA